MEYRGSNVRLKGSSTEADIRATLVGIRAQGGNAVAFVTVHKCSVSGTDICVPTRNIRPWALIRPDWGQDPLHPNGDTASIFIIESAVDIAIELGFERILLAPHIDSDDADWRGEFTLPQELRTAFQTSYKEDFLAGYLPVVKRRGVDLCIEVELVKISEHYGSDFWIEIVRWLREEQGVTQRLTAAMNWGWENSAEFMMLLPLCDVLDYVGVNCYYPLVNDGYHGPVTVDMVLSKEGLNCGWWRGLEGADGKRQSWCPPIVTAIQNLKAITNKDVYFTEIGFQNNSEAALNPSGGNTALPYSTDWSLPIWLAAREVWEPILSGWFTWDAGVGTVLSSTDNLLGTPMGDIAWAKKEPAA